MSEAIFSERLPEPGFPQLAKLTHDIAVWRRTPEAPIALLAGAKLAAAETISQEEFRAYTNMLSMLMRHAAAD